MGDPQNCSLLLSALVSTLATPSQIMTRQGRSCRRWMDVCFNTISGGKRECPKPSEKHHAAMENFVFSFRGRIRSQGLTLSDRDLFATQSQKLGRTWQIFVLGDKRQNRFPGIRWQRRIRDGGKCRRVVHNREDNLAMGVTPWSKDCSWLQVNGMQVWLIGWQAGGWRAR